MCVRGTDCADCGSRGTGCSGRRLDETELSTTDFSAEPASEAFAGMAEAAVASATEPIVPGARRLLKGGSSGGFGGSSSGRSSGNSYSAGSRTSSRIASSSSNTRYIPSGTSRSTASRGVSYGGRSSYSVGGRTYAGSYSGYSYRRAPRAYGMGTGMVLIGPHGYGCYSCRGYRHSCNSCNNCYSRSQCGGQRESTLATSFDRYELSINITTDDTGGYSWPLNLTISRADVYMQRTSSQNVNQHSVYITFNTDAGDAFAQFSEPLVVIGWVTLFISSYYMFRKRKQLFQGGGAKASQYAPNTPSMGGAIPPAVYGHCTQPCTQPVAMPMATYPQTYPTPQAYPAQAMAQPQAYPAQACAVQAYPATAQPTYPASYPPSPTPPNKDE